MKKIFSALVIALLAIGANAQTFEKGSSIVTAQLGIGGGFGQRVAYEYSLMNLLDGKAETASAHAPAVITKVCKDRT